MMDERKFAFLKAVLGIDGATSLKKAADKYEDLEGAIVPRAIMAWLGVVSRSDYEGGLPGVDDSYLDFSKNGDSTFSGSIAIGDGVFPFQNASIFHLAASVAISLGATLDGGNIKDIDMVRLGKSIDVLVKANNFLAGAALQKAAPGPPQRPKVRGAPVEPAVPTKQIGQKPVPASEKPAVAPKQAKLPKHKIPSLKVKTAKVPTKALKSECKECGQLLIKNEKFVGCLCFRDLAPSVKLAKHQDGHYSLAFNNVDEDAELAILEALGVNHG